MLGLNGASIVDGGLLLYERLQVIHSGWVHRSLQLFGCLASGCVAEYG